MPDFETCPNCNSQLKNGVYLVSEDRTKGINIFTENKSPGFCNKCFVPVARIATANRNTALKSLKEQIDKDLLFIPVITLQTPANWNYTVIKLVTAQCVTGTGALTELTNLFYEFLGTESTRMDNKIKNGENTCTYRLRIEAVKAGANAVIATDIDYAELSGMRDMIMVCMSGTAIKLDNVEVLANDMKVIFDRIYSNIVLFDEYSKLTSIIV
jgi:uncharacterized protein YbjQ (UPF0145 family)